MPVSASRIISCLKPSEEVEETSSAFYKLPDELIFVVLRYLNGTEVQRSRLVSRRFNQVFKQNKNRWPLPEIAINVGFDWYNDQITFNIRSLEHKSEVAYSPAVMLCNANQAVVASETGHPRLQLEYYRRQKDFTVLDVLASMFRRNTKDEVRVSCSTIDEAIKLHLAFLAPRFNIHFDEVSFNDNPTKLSVFVRNLLESEVRIASIRSIVKAYNEDVPRFFESIYSRGCLNYTVVDISKKDWIQKVPIRNINCVMLDSKVTWELDFMLKVAKRWITGDIEVGALLVVHETWWKMEDNVKEIRKLDPRLEVDWEGCLIRRPKDGKALRFERFRAGGNYDNSRTVLYNYDETRSLTSNRYSIYKAMREHPNLAYSRGFLRL